jgi:hypothetical protein
MIQLRIKKLEDEANTLRSRFRVVFVALTLMATLNVAFLFPSQVAILQTKINDFTSTTQTNFVQKESPKVSNSDYQTSINSFYNNTAFTEIGSQLNIKKNSLSTQDTKNCNTDTVPGLENGCGLVFRPYAAGINPNTSKLMNIKFKITSGPKDRIAVDLINSESKTIKSSLGKTDPTFKEMILKLPSKLAPDEQILIRLWPQLDSVIVLEEVILESLDISKLQPVEIKFDPLDSTRLAGKELEVYLDSDKNGILDKEIDPKWNCNNGFPGVKTSVIQAEAVKLLRDSDCITADIPTNWRADSGSNSLSPFYYLLVTKTDSKTDVFPLQVVNGVSEYQVVPN